jgi:hypothetical protein
LLKK